MGVAHRAQFIVGVAVIVLITTTQTSLAASFTTSDVDEQRVDDVRSPSTPTVVLLPLMNHTPDARARDVLAPRLLARVAELPFTLITGEELRATLRTNRIRAVGGIGLTGARTLHREFGADYVLTGSYDVFLEHPGTSEIGLSLRLIDVRTYRVVWAQSAGATGRDYESVLGMGRVKDIDELVDRVIDEVLEGLVEILRNPASDPADDGERVAVVPFDDVLLYSPGGGIVTAQVVTELVKRGFHTIEPGIVREFFINYQRFSRGGIDYEVLGALHDSLGVTGVVTGSVDGFHLGVPELETSYPHLTVSGRLIDAGTRDIVSMTVVSGTGDHETIIGWGHTRAANDLAGSTTSALLNELKLTKGSRHAH